MAVRLSELAKLVGGELIGDDDPWISGAAALVEADHGDITLIDHPDRAVKLADSHAAAAVTPAGVESAGLPLLHVADVHEAFTAIVRHFRPARTVKHGGISSRAIVSPTARIAADVDIRDNAVIDDEVTIGVGSVIHPGVHVMAGSHIGAQVTIFSNVTIHEDTEIGARSIIHAGSVIGSYGFGYRMVEGRHQLTSQLGHVRIEADVEVGAGSTIDRGSYGATVIGEGTKIDNQVQIGHNCRIGRHNLICSQVGIAGSTTTGDYVVIAGQVGVRDHVMIGDRAVIGAMAGISNDVPADSRMLGIPATPEREQKLKQAALAKLPEMRKEMKALAATVAELNRRLADNGTSGPTSPTTVHNEAA